MVIVRDWNILIIKMLNNIKMWEFLWEKRLKKNFDFFLCILLNGKDVIKESNLVIYLFYGKEFVFIINVLLLLFIWLVI